MTDTELTDEHTEDAFEREISSALLLQYEERIANLEIALVSNRRIGIAIGILMSQHAYTEARAFEQLRSLSQRTNRKLRDIADEVIYTGTLPD